MASDLSQDERVEGLKELYDERQEEFAKMQERIKEDIMIDEFDLGNESLRTPILHQRYLTTCADQVGKMLTMESKYKKVYLERWKYWNGMQTDKYYAKYGHINEKILKGDLDKYLNQDPVLVEMKRILELEKRVVDYLERIVKEITNRGWIIKNAIEWAKFQSGA